MCSILSHFTYAVLPELPERTEHISAMFIA